MRKLFIILCILITCTIFLDALHAQPKSVGSTFSYAGSGIVYEHSIDSDSFAEIQLRAETAHTFADRMNKPGFSASFTWNMTFAEIESRGGDRVIFFAGPGATAGMAGDMIGSGYGLFFGLKGRLGGECTFRNKVAVSLSVSPVLGLHLGARDGMVNMLLYKNGLLYSIMPEVGIKYAF